MGRVDSANHEYSLSRAKQGIHPGSEPSSEVLRHGTEIASRAPETDVTIGPHKILGGVRNIEHAESRESVAAAVDQCARNRLRGEVVQKNQAGVASGNFGELGTIPTLQGSA